MQRLTDDNFAEQVLRADRPAVVLFGLDGCSPCAAVKDELSLLERLYGDDIRTCFAEKSATPSAHNRYASGGVPVLLIFNAGAEVWRKRGGSVTASMASLWIDDLLEQK